MPSIFFRDLCMRKPLHDIRDFLEIWRKKKKRKNEEFPWSPELLHLSRNWKKAWKVQNKRFLFQNTVSEKDKKTKQKKHLSTYFKVIFNAMLSCPGGRGCIDLSLAYSSFISKSLFNHLLKAWNWFLLC